MRILLTGANGYIGMRLLPVLVEAGHEVTCVVRDAQRFQPSKDLLSKVSVIEYDFLYPQDAERIFKGLQFDVAYYLIHSLKDTFESLEEMERVSAVCFVNVLRITGVKQLIYLGGISNQSGLSTHLRARQTVKKVLMLSRTPYTIFEAGIIVGSGSASFEIIRDLVEKLPVMVGPDLLLSKCQPIAIRNVINYLKDALMNEKTFNKTFEIGGPDILTYKDMLLQYAEVRGFKRLFLTVPFVSGRMSSFMLYFITSTNFTIASQLVASMKNDVVCQNNSVRDLLPQELYSYKEAINMAFQVIKQNMVVSSWRDASTSTLQYLDINEYIEVPEYGCYQDKKCMEIQADKIEEVTDRFFGIGGKHGWFYADTLWRFRGWIDKMFLGVGLQRGRKSEVDLKPGDALDFWRVLVADRKNHRLLLFAEMKLPGEAWLEFAIIKKAEKYFLKQTATFRPHNIMGRNYWYSMLPFHYFIFRNMIKRISEN